LTHAITFSGLAKPLDPKSVSQLSLREVHCWEVSRLFVDCDGGGQPELLILLMQSRTDGVRLEVFKPQAVEMFAQDEESRLFEDCGCAPQLGLMLLAHAATDAGLASFSIFVAQVNEMEPQDEDDESRLFEDFD